MDVFEFKSASDLADYVTDQAIPASEVGPIMPVEGRWFLFTGTGLGGGGGGGGGDIEGVTAGNGLTGGGVSGTVTLNVGAGAGISVTADAVAVDTTAAFTPSWAGAHTFTAAGTAVDVTNNVVVGGTVTATGAVNANGGVQRSSAGALSIGTTGNTTSIAIGNGTITTALTGSLTVSVDATVTGVTNANGGLQRSSAGTLSIGTTSDSTAIAIGNGSITTTLTGNLSLAPAASASGTPTTSFLWTGPAHVDITSNTEYHDIFLNLAREVNWLDGTTQATQRFIRIGGPSLSSDGATTITDADTLYIDAPAATGGNMTLTRANAIRIGSGQLRLPGGSSSTPSISFATSGANTGIYSSASNVVVISANGGGQLSVSTTQVLIASDLTAQDAVRFTGVISPTQLTADQNNYAPTGFADAFMVRQDVDATGRTITGLAGGLGGRLIIFSNIATGAPNTITFTHDDTGNSTAANCFFCPNNASYVLSPNESVLLCYDSTSSRWRVVGTV